MEKGLNREISAIYNGIAGLYRPRHYKMRIVIAVLLVLAIVVGVLLAAAYKSNSWQGRLIVLCKNKAAYERFYNFYPNLLEEMGMSESEFEERASFKYTTDSDGWAQILDAAGLNGEEVVTRLKSGGKLSIRPIVVVIDKDKNILYEGSEEHRLIEALVKSGFKR